MLKYFKQSSNMAQILVFHCVTLDKLHNSSVCKPYHLKNRAINTRTDLLAKLNNEFVMYLSAAL